MTNVKVKPLAWGEKETAPERTSPGYSVEAKTILGRYRIDYFESNAINGGPFLLTCPDLKSLRELQSLEEAKAAAAQADYERRVLSALELEPQETSDG